MRKHSIYSKFTAKAAELRQGGMTYTAIDKALQLPIGTAWRLLNLERARANARDSFRQYTIRKRSRSADPFLDPVRKGY